MTESIKNRWIIAALILPPLLISVISTVHVIRFFGLSNGGDLSLSLAVAFEVGAIAALVSLGVMEKVSQKTVWMIFLSVTLMQCLGNMFYAYDYVSRRLAEDPRWIDNFTELIGLSDSSIIVQKRVLAFLTGAILPMVSMGFTHHLVNIMQGNAAVTQDAKRILTPSTELLTDSPLIRGVAERITGTPFEGDVISPNFRFLEPRMTAEEIIPVRAMESPDGTGLRASMDVVTEEEAQPEPQPEPAPARPRSRRVPIMRYVGDVPVVEYHNEEDAD